MFGPTIGSIVGAGSIRGVNMDTDHTSNAKAAADRVVELEAELEAAGEASTEGASLEKARAALHKWVDEMTGIVVSPALGRVTLIHPNGRFSTISSPELPFTLSLPTKNPTGSNG
jgi:hypothetical protein